MKRSMGNKQMWGATLKVASGGGTGGRPVYFEYKYLAIDSSGQTWVETGPVRRVRVDTAVGADEGIEQEDAFDDARHLTA